MYLLIQWFRVFENCDVVEDDRLVAWTESTGTI